MTAWYALCDAKKEKYGHLVIGGSERKKGSGKDPFGGWRLTEQGVQWVKENRERIEKMFGGTMKPDNRLQESRRLRALINSQAFVSYQAQGIENISHADLAESLMCTVNTPTNILLERIDQLLSTAKTLNQNDVVKYLLFCRKLVSNNFVGV
jgi:hypothetical protein